MENNPIKLDNILEQAPNWTFAGDFTLLQWMNKISQDLETRANKTTEALTKLHNNVLSTNIALDNVANSLTALQFGNQFVECRVQDDDETLANVNEANREGNNQIDEIPSSKEMLKTFLDNNLKILRNCHEKYSIDLDDSDDDEEGRNEKTCIYQPINPYNERPLPYTFGSKDWHAKWHVGVFENHQDNNYSGDEISETFSESSRSASEENESFESNTEWASSNSIDIDNYNANVEIRNASSLRGSQPIFPGTPRVPVKVNKAHTTISESSSLSTPSSSLATKAMQTKKHTETKTSRSESVSSINSKESAKNPTNSQSIAKEKPFGYRTPAPPFVDLFAEPPEDIESTSSSVSSTQHTKRPSVDYTTTIPSQTKSVSAQRPSLFKTQSPKFVDLFAEPPEDIPPKPSSSVSSNQNIKRKPVNLFDDDEDESDLLPPQANNENIYESKNNGESFIKEREFYENDLLPVQTKNTEVNSIKIQSRTETIVNDKPLNVSITPKSLFDDDGDEDDDFLKAFVKKSSTESSLTKTLLFDNDFISESPKKPIKTNLLQQDAKKEDFIDTSKTKVTNTGRAKIFDEIQDDDDNSLFSISNKNKSSKVLTTESVEQLSNPVNDSKETSDLRRKTYETKADCGDKNVMASNAMADTKKSVNLFDNFEEIYLEKEDLKRTLETEKVNVDSFAAKSKKKINLFNDLEDDEDDFFVQKPKQILKNNLASDQAKLVSQQTSIKQKTNETDSLNKENTQELLTKSKEDIASSTEFLCNEINSEEIVKKSLETTEKDINENAENQMKYVSREEITKANETKTMVNKYAKQLLNDEQLNSSNNEAIPIAKKELNNNMSLDSQKKLKNVTQKTLLQNEQIQPNPTDFGKAENPPSLDDEVPSSSKETIMSSTTTKYDFNSIMFLDEPPEDDSEFFETLAKKPLTLNTKYNSIDLDNDLYEPELPKVPTANTTINPIDSADNRQTSLYTGLQLFSDIPPDDDEEDNINKLDINPSASNSTQTKRLHSVFYDDFNETLAALSKNQEDTISSHSIFHNEPPPYKVEDKTANIDFSKDVVDHKIAIAKQEEVVVEKPDSKSALSSYKRPVSKLQMPNININVQALLPGAGTATLLKTKKDSTLSTEIEPEKFLNITPQAKVGDIQSNKKETNVSHKIETIMVSKKETVTVPKTAETEHILPNVTKNRVRAPATRRPSTRKARQDNYRKSLIEEEQHFIESANKKEDSNVTQLPSNLVEVKSEPLLHKDKKIHINASLFDDDKDNSDTFKKIKIQPKLDIPTQSPIKIKSNIEKQDHEDAEVKAPNVAKQPLKDQVANKPETKDSFRQTSSKEDKKSTNSAIIDKLEDGSKLFSNTITSLSKEVVDDTKNEKNEETKNSPKSSLQNSDKKPSSNSKDLILFESNSLDLILFENETEDHGDLFKHIKSKDGVKTKMQTKSMRNDPPKDNSEIQSDSRKLTSSLLFTEKEEEHDSDFFKHIKTSKSTEVEKQNLLPTEVEEHIITSHPNKPSSRLNLPTQTVSNTLLENQKQVPKQDSKQLKSVKNSTSFLDDYNDDDDNLFDIPDTSKSSVVIISSSKPNETKPENTNLKNVSLLDNKDSKDNDAFQTQTSVPRAIIKPTNSANPIKTLASTKTNATNTKKANFKSFLDNESDEDFTVAGLQTIKTAPYSKTVNPSKTLTQKTKPTKSGPSKLFTDSDTDSDDLFGKTKTTKTSNKPINKTKPSNKNQTEPTTKITENKPQASIFSDDSDGDDFLKTSRSATKKVISKSSTKENKPKVEPPANVSLFSDIDSDEDDLFGSGGVTKPATSIANVKPSAASQPVASTIQTSKPKNIADNPLADLL